MENVHIYSPQRWLGRTVDFCGTCRCRRRFIVAHFQWNSSVWICGGCGHQWASGEGRYNNGKTQREKNRRWVSQTWPSIVTSAEAVQNMSSTFEKIT
jgi:hypothetical protein